MEITDEVKKFLEKNKHLILSKNYAELFDRYTATYSKSDLTKILLAAKIDFLPYLTSIPDNSFNSLYITSITIPDSITKIESWAFVNCFSLATITIPDSVTNIGLGAFANCESLTDIIIPDSVASIGRDAFYNCNKLTSVTIPNSVKSIAENTFHNCSSLTSITISNSVTNIWHSAFDACRMLKDVYYDGTKEDFEKIVIMSEGNDYLINATWHYLK